MTPQNHRSGTETQNGSRRARPCASVGFRAFVACRVAVVFDRVKTYASFVKLEHTVFSLPLIVSGAVLAARGWPRARLLGLLLLAAASARVVAMGLNRIIDVEIDKRNPRTRQRELPRGAMRMVEAWGIVVIAGLLYGAAAAAIAPICLRFAPIPVALFVVYPYLKRFTVLSHLGLGLAWSMAPLGGWLAVSQSLGSLHEIGWLWIFSLVWVAGFDIIYATMDEAFDREWGLHSLPARVGRRRALRISLTLHLFAFCSLLELWRRQLGDPFGVVWALLIGVLLLWEQDLAEERPMVAFFRLNAAISVLVLVFVLVGLK